MLPTVIPPELHETLRRRAKRLRRVEVLRDIADNEDGCGLDTADLLELYVPPWLRPGAVVRDEEKREQALRRQLRDPALTPGEAARLARVHAGSLQRSWVADWRRSGHISPLRALAEHRHVVVLGPPGAGKTTLLRIVELTQIDPELRDPWATQQEPEEPRVSAAIRLAEYAFALQTEPGLSLMTYLERAVPDAVAPLRAGEALLLLDGLDEVDTLELRKEVATAIRTCIDAQERLCCMVTTRPSGAVLLPGFAVFHLDLFTEEMAIEFLIRWRASRGGRAERAQPRAALRRQAVVQWQQLRAQESLEQLARNPLMLAILALCDEAQLELPHDRVQFYERALRTLLDTWNHSRAGGEDDLGVSLDVQWRAWGELALVLREEFPIGVFPRAAVKRGLVAQLVRLGEREATGSELAERLLRRAVERHGLLERRGDDGFAFWHATFGEYLAATALAQDGTPRRLLALRGDPRNVEIAAMTLGHLAIVQGDRVRAAAWLANLAAPDDRAWGPLATAQFDFATSCVRSGCGATRESLDAMLCVAAARVLELPYRPWGAAFVRLADVVPGLRPSAELVRSLAPLARSTRVRAIAATQPAVLRLLALASPSDEAACQLCSEVANPAYSAAVRYDPFASAYATLGLLRAGKVVVVWLPAIAMVSWHDERNAERELNDFAVALHDAVKDRQIARELGGLLSDAEPNVRRAAALALALVGDARPAVLNELLVDRAGILLEPLEQVVLARLVRSEPTAAEQLVVTALADRGPENADPERSWAPACLARAMSTRGPHCQAIGARLVDALSGELGAEGPAWQLLSALVAGHERPHVAASLLREGQRRLRDDPDATRLALLCALLSDGLRDSESWRIELEILVACVRRGGIAQRLVAHSRLASAWYHADREESNALLADAEVNLLAEALQHPQDEELERDPVWEVNRGSSAYLLSPNRLSTWGAVRDHIFGSIERRYGRATEQSRIYVEPLRRAISAGVEPLRSYAAVLLAPLLDEAEEREQVGILVVGLLNASHLELRAAATRWLASHRERSEVAARITPHSLQIALCASMRIHDLDDDRSTIAALGPADDALVVALLHEGFPVEALDPAWLFARVETVELVASYIGHDDEDLHTRAFNLLLLGRDREDVTAAVFRHGLATTVDNAANFANLLSQRFSGAQSRDPRVDALWRRALDSTNPGTLWRTVDSLLWRDGPGPAIRGALLRIFVDEGPYTRIYAAWTCIAYLVRATQPPIGIGALAQPFADLVSVEQVIEALTAVVRRDEPLLVGAAAVMLHALGGPVELVGAALERLTRDRRSLNSTFNLWGPNFRDLTRIAVDPVIARCAEQIDNIADWALFMRAAGLGGADPGARDRLAAALADDVGDRDQRSGSRRDELHLRLLLAVDADVAGQTFDRIFAAIDEARVELAACTTPWSPEPAVVAAATVHERWWTLISQCLDDDRVLQRAVEQLLRWWPAGSERRRTWADRRSRPTPLHDRIRAMLARYLVADEPGLRYAAARWCCQLGEPNPVVLAVWAEGLLAEGLDRSLFRGLDGGEDGEVARGAQYLCEHVELWQSSPRHMRTIISLLRICGRPPPGARDLVQAALASDDDELRLAAASLCEEHELDAPPAELAAAWRAGLASASPMLDFRHVADIVLRLAPDDPVAVEALRRGAVDGDRRDRLRALESLEACPDEHAFVRALLAEWLAQASADDLEDHSSLSRALQMWQRVGADEEAVVEHMIAGVMDARLDPAAMARDPSQARHRGGARSATPIEAGQLLADVVTVIDDALARMLAQAVGADVDRLGATWLRIVKGERCSQDDARVVHAVLTCRPDDDDRIRFARGWWNGRLPKDDHGWPIWPPTAEPEPAAQREAVLGEERRGGQVASARERAEARFTLEEKIGSGGYAEVYAATDNLLRRRVAIKLFKPGGTNISSAADHAQALARIQHNNVVTVFEVTRMPHPDDKEERSAIIMEYLDGPTLAKLLGGPPLERERAVELCTGIIAGITALHREGIVHYDLHDENIQLDATGTPKILDILYRGTLMQLPEMARKERVRQDVAVLTQILIQILVHSLQADAAVSLRGSAAGSSTMDDVARAFERAVPATAGLKTVE